MLYNEAYELIKNSNNIAIFTHSNPDCDGIASSIALKLHFEDIGKKVQLFCEDDVPQYLNFLPFSDTFLKECNNIQIYDLAIILDSVNLDRLGSMANYASIIKNKIVIDHHEEFIPFANINISNKDASSTGEILYNFFTKNNIVITEDIGSCIYAAIASDTGGFIQSNINPEVFKIVNTLIEYNVDYKLINERLFAYKSLSKILLLKHALNNVNFFNQYAICILTNKDYKECNSEFSDNIGLIDYIKCIEGINICALISEKENNEYYVSIRSKGRYSANLIAKQFNGGGHHNAAGCRIMGDLKDVVSALITAIKKELNYECNN